MSIANISRVYFLGIGGIGMSALARFFLRRGAFVSGYDRTPTELTNQLEAERMVIHFEENLDLIDRTADLVIYTPAIPKSHIEFVWYNENKYPVFKRSDVLNWITQEFFTITVAGTHGKTTISTMIAYLLRETGYGCNAFLGGISSNYESNYWSSPNDVAVVEADEYDRSFLKLFPDIAVLTAIDPDHLDIYGTPEAMEEAFIQYTRNIKEGGRLLLKHGLHRHADLATTATTTYSFGNMMADICAVNVRPGNGGYMFDVQAKEWEIKDVALNVGGLHNVENAVAAIAVTQMLGIDPHEVVKAFAGFRGVKRRFEYILKRDNLVFIDDYAHHPAELQALISGARSLFPELKCTICFQPHLFTRTRDLADGFAHSLDLADEIWLLDIYPARELPIEGVTTAMIMERMVNKNVKIISKQDFLKNLEENNLQLLITAGAGDIDKLVAPAKEILMRN